MSSIRYSSHSCVVDKLTDDSDLSVGAFGFGVGGRVGGKSGKSGTGRVGVDRVGRGGGDAERMGLMQQPQQEARITNRAKKKLKPGYSYLSSRKSINTHS